METIKFEEQASERIYKQYLKEVRAAVKRLPAADQREVLMEINSHLYEGLQRETEWNETDHLANLIDRLGKPKEVLKPLVADKLLERATRTFNPLHVIKALAINITNGISYIVFAFLYLCLFSFALLIFLKIADPEHTGLFLLNGSFEMLGQTTRAEQYDEVLGGWFIPVILAVTVLCYFLITFLLKLKRSIRKTHS